MVTKSPLSIGVIAPPWLPVPPVNYGGTELVLDVLCRGLQQRGNRVELFTLGTSTCDVPRRWIYESADPDRMGAAIAELRHVAAAYEAFERYDVVHDHTLGGLFHSGLYPHVPVVTTNHGPFNEDLIDFYGRVADRIPIIAISHDQASRAPAGIPVSAVIHHGLDLERYPIGTGGEYLLSLGRMNPDKGIEVAIDVARRAGRELLIAAKMREPAEKRYFAEVIEPMLGDGFNYVGEVGHERKVELLQGAAALLNPIRWPEPFGLVMAEALACGTPVVATPCGAAPEIVEHGTVGFLGDDVEALVNGVRRVESIDRDACRAHVERSFTMARMAADHENFYRSVLESRLPRPSVDRPTPIDSRTPAVGSAGRRPYQLRMSSTAGSRPVTRIS